MPHRRSHRVSLFLAMPGLTALGLATAMMVGGSTSAAASGRSLEVMARSLPSMVSVGATTMIEVAVTSPDGVAADAEVVIDAGGGSFEAGGEATVRGRTDARGRFAAAWHCEPPCSASYLMRVTARKSGYADSGAFVVWVEVAGGGVARARPEVSAVAAAAAAASPSPAVPAPAAAPPADWQHCAWIEIGAAGTFHDGTAWCPDGSFLTQLEQQSIATLDPHESPVVARAKCCRPAGVVAAGGGGCWWQRVGPRLTHEPHEPWCSAGTFLTQILFDQRRDPVAADAPVVAKAKCCALGAATSGAWGECTRVAVGREAGRDTARDWCPAGSFLTQLDFDAAEGLDVAESPIVGRAICCLPLR